MSSNHFINLNLSFPNFLNHFLKTLKLVLMSKLLFPILDVYIISMTAQISCFLAWLWCPLSFGGIPCELLVPGGVDGLKVNRENLEDGVLVHDAVIFDNLTGASG